MKLKVALLQIASHGSDQAANLLKGEEYCRRAAAQGADIALFPEMWNVGYGFEGGQYSVKNVVPAAIGCDDRFVAHFRALARDLDMAIALTYLEKWPDRPRNSVSLIDRHGEIAMTYAKVHTCEFSDECVLAPGDDFYVCSLDTAEGEVKIGAMICYDREFPESARILMLKGAEIILVPNACTMDYLRIAQLQTRAIENMVGVALANYPAPQDNGHSIAFDAAAYPEEDGPARDVLIVEAGESEGIYMATFDMDSIRAYRERETWGNAYRRPRLYGLLTSERVEPPFVRADATR